MRGKIIWKENYQDLQEDVFWHGKVVNHSSLFHDVFLRFQYFPQWAFYTFKKGKCDKC